LWCNAAQRKSPVSGNQEDLLGNETQKALLVIDHKETVIQYREGQIEYSGKHGMSLLGAMLVSRRVEGDSSVGLGYIFFDCTVKIYSSQDNMQVLGVLSSLLRLTKVQCLDITEISI
jgi:hypothetical protein